MRGEDRLPYDIKKGEALLMPFSSINGINLENADETAYGKLEYNYCYVIVVNNDNKIYSYYLTLLDETKHGINNIEANELQDNSVTLITDASIRAYASLGLSSTFTFKNDTYKVSKIQKNLEDDSIRYIVLEKN